MSETSFRMTGNSELSLNISNLDVLEDVLEDEAGDEIADLLTQKSIVEVLAQSIVEEVINAACNIVTTDGFISVGSGILESSLLAAPVLHSEDAENSFTDEVESVCAKPPTPVSIENTMRHQPVDMFTVSKLNNDNSGSSCLNIKPQNVAEEDQDECVPEDPSKQKVHDDGDKNMPKSIELVGDLDLQEKKKPVGQSNSEGVAPPCTPQVQHGENEIQSSAKSLGKLEHQKDAAMVNMSKLNDTSLQEDQIGAEPVNKMNSQEDKDIIVNLLKSSEPCPLQEKIRQEPHGEINAKEEVTIDNLSKSVDPCPQVPSSQEINVKEKAMIVNLSQSVDHCPQFPSGQDINVKEKAMIVNLSQSVDRCPQFPSGQETLVKDINVKEKAMMVDQSKTIDPCPQDQSGQELLSKINVLEEVMRIGQSKSDNPCPPEQIGQQSLDEIETQEKVVLVVNPSNSVLDPSPYQEQSCQDPLGETNVHEEPMPVDHLKSVETCPQQVQSGQESLGETNGQKELMTVDHLKSVETCPQQVQSGQESLGEINIHKKLMTVDHLKSVETCPQQVHSSQESLGETNVQDEMMMVNLLSLEDSCVQQEPYDQESLSEVEIQEDTMTVSPSNSGAQLLHERGEDILRNVAELAQIYGQTVDHLLEQEVQLMNAELNELITGIGQVHGVLAASMLQTQALTEEAQMQVVPVVRRSTYLEEDLRCGLQELSRMLAVVQNEPGRPRSLTLAATGDRPEVDMRRRSITGSRSTIRVTREHLARLIAEMEDISPLRPETSEGEDESCERSLSCSSKQDVCEETREPVKDGDEEEVKGNHCLVSFSTTDSWNDKYNTPVEDHPLVYWHKEVVQEHNNEMQSPERYDIGSESLLSMYGCELNVLGSKSVVDDFTEEASMIVREMVDDVVSNHEVKSMRTLPDNFHQEAVFLLNGIVDNAVRSSLLNAATRSQTETEPRGEEEQRTIGDNWDSWDWDIPTTGGVGDVRASIDMSDTSRQQEVPSTAEREVPVEEVGNEATQLQKQKKKKIGFRQRIRNALAAFSGRGHKKPSSS